MTGGVFNGACSTASAEILVIDSDDPDNPRADVPGFGDEIWAGLADAEVDPDLVNAAFDDIVWIDNNKAKGGENENDAKNRNPSDAANGTLPPTAADVPADTPDKVLAEFISDADASPTPKPGWPATSRVRARRSPYEANWTPSWTESRRSRPT
jgi:hypothetical protein